MAQDFVDRLMAFATENDEGVLDRLDGYMHGHLAAHPGDKTAERHRIAKEFSEKAPPSALTQDMLAIIQP
jgi:hypothetical protein